ncbi:MAG: type II toxin-antitoxin system VapB family antitoxin [Chloroflexi bacterium]|nr:type II toxin-antitoxin system VapB family antitoxin [Chloroflexota bacterium]
MALNIKDPETERLAREVAALTGESKTGAIRRALHERKQRLLLRNGERDRGARLIQFLERDVWPRLPVGCRGGTTTKEQVEEILGYGPEGV